MRCEEPCGKVIYTSETTAQLQCVKTALAGDSSLTWYKSGKCGHGVWHVTNMDKRGNTGKRHKWVEGFKNDVGCRHDHETEAGHATAA
jgi:hypothetical protein